MKSQLIKKRFSNNKEILLKFEDYTKKKKILSSSSFFLALFLAARAYSQKPISFEFSQVKRAPQRGRPVGCRTAAPLQRALKSALFSHWPLLLSRTQLAKCLLLEHRYLFSVVSDAQKRPRLSGKPARSFNKVATGHPTCLQAGFSCFFPVSRLFAVKTLPAWSHFVSCHTCTDSLISQHNIIRFV